MPGTGWKATGIVFLVLGGIVFLLGLGGAVFGGLMWSDAVGDAASSCGPFGCDETAEGRMEAGAMTALASGYALGAGILLLLVGALLLIIGIVRGRNVWPAASNPPLT